MSKQRERRIFWLLAIWVAIWPLLQSPNLSAENGDYILQTDPEEIATDTVTAGASLTTSAEDEVTEGNADADSFDMPALSADPNELLAKVNGLARSGKHNEVITELADYEDAVVELEALLEIYLEALLKSDKPDWNTINRLGRALSGKNPGSSLANYAQGMYWQNARKPDMAKAVTFLGKARSAKKPYSGAATAYYLALARKFWQIPLLLIIIPVALIIRKRRNKAKSAVIDLDLPEENVLPAQEPFIDQSDSNATPPAEKVVTDSLPAEETKNIAEEASEAKPDEPALPQTTRKVVKIVRKVKTVVRPKEATEKSGEESGSETLSEVAPETVNEIAPEVAADDLSVAESVEVEPPAPSQPTSDEVSSRLRIDTEKVGDLTRPQRPPSVQADPELDAIWNDLSQKALQGRIVPLARPQENLYGSFVSSGLTGQVAEAAKVELDTSDVSIDLSEEALQDDLIGKLKMLAITDGELREMFAMKNPGHIPHLIEYVLTRPEPVRLAFVAREIGHYDDAAVIDVLASLLYHEDERVVLAAVQGMENSCRPAAVLHLCPFIRSEAPLIAQAARTALANFGAGKILQAFQDLSAHPDVRIREAGVFVLSRMKGKAVEELLKKMLLDRSLEVRNKTILAMSYQKNPSYIECLREFFRSANESDKALARKAIVYLQGFASR